MASGRDNKLVGQTGEYLVAAELSRRGLIATTFTGNVPHYDIIVSDEIGRHASVQVKAARLGSWQFGNMGNFCEIEFQNKRQLIGKAKVAPVRRLVFTFVKIGEEPGGDRFYVLSWAELRNLLIKKYADFLLRNDGIRQKKWDSLHVAVKETMLLPYRDKWQLIHDCLK